jgi:hypothetical protein
MIRRQPLPFIVLVLAFLSLPVWGGTRIVPEAGLLCSGEFSYSTGTEYADAGGRVAIVGLPGFMSGTLNIGYYRALSPKIALRICGLIGSGSEKREIWKDASIIYESSGETVVESHDLRLIHKHSYLGLAVEGLYYFHRTRRIRYYGFAGAGMNKYAITQKIAIEDNTDMDGDPVDMDGLLELEKIALSLSGGAGAYFRLYKSIKMFLQYKLRFWRPLEHTFSEVGVSYNIHDNRFCHIGEAGVVFGL